MYHMLSDVPAICLCLHNALEKSLQFCSFIANYYSISIFFIKSTISTTNLSLTFALPFYQILYDTFFRLMELFVQ